MAKWKRITCMQRGRKPSSQVTEGRVRYRKRVRVRGRKIALVVKR